MWILGAVLAFAQAAPAAPPSRPPARPPAESLVGHCSAVVVSSPEAPKRRVSFSATKILDLEFGAMLRSRREQRENQVQNRAALVQNLQAGLWLIAMASFGAWGAKAFYDPAGLVFGWPGPLLVTASACALVAAALTVTTLVALPAVWRTELDELFFGRRLAVEEGRALASESLPRPGPPQGRRLDAGPLRG